MSNELAKTGITAELTTGASGYCSVKGDDMAARKTVFNAMNNPDGQISDYINKTIQVVDVFVSELELVDENTGETVMAPRVVFIDAKGKSYACVSKGIYNALRNAVAVFGEPTWEPPLPITIKQVNVGKGSMLTFDVA